MIAAVGVSEFPKTERRLQTVDRERSCRNNQRRHETRRDRKLLLRKVVRKPSSGSHHGEGDEEEAHAAERLPSECDKRRDAADSNHPAEVIEQMVERELRASGLFDLEEGRERARLRLANDAALGRRLELGPVNVHRKNQVSTTRPTLSHGAVIKRSGCNSGHWWSATSARIEDMGWAAGIRPPQDERQAHAADKAILLGWGMPDDDAEITAEGLAWSDLHGHR